MAKRSEVSLEALFRALADPTRLRILNLIGSQEICVCYFVEVLGVNQPKVSRHLAYLRRAGIVSTRREGKWMHYRISLRKDGLAGEVLGETLKRLAVKPEMKRDIARLSSACCSPGKFVLLEGAPQPQMLEEMPR